MDGGTVNSYDVAIIGAGPAGIGAALAAASAGSSVVIVDEQAGPGGRLRTSVAVQRGVVGDLTDARGFEFARWAGGALDAAGVTQRFGVTVWGLFDGNTLAVAGRDWAGEITAKAIVVATGAVDAVAPFDGWDLPGVMTVSAALRLLHEHRVAPGERVAVVGSGADADEVAEALALAGVPVAAWAKTASDVRCGGANGVEWVEIGGERVDADALIIALGRSPDPALVAHLGGELTYSEAHGAFVPMRTEDCETTVAGVFAAGGCAGSQSAAQSFAEGQIAGAVAAGGAAQEGARSTMSQNVAAQAAMVPGIADSVCVCRCEGVSAAEVRQAVNEGAPTINDVKRRTRAGMGACQGTYCAAAIRALIHEGAGLPHGDIAPMTVRPPARMLPLTLVTARDAT